MKLIQRLFQLTPVLLPISKLFVGSLVVSSWPDHSLAAALPSPQSFLAQQVLTHPSPSPNIPSSPVLQGIEGKASSGIDNFSAAGNTDPQGQSSPLLQRNRIEKPQKPTSNYPTFNSEQLDELLQTYRQYVATQGRPDILIVGSSRAAMGIDPIALQRGLFMRGYPKLKVFNFGINGATAQVVDLLVREILPPAHLPRLIIWADGVRAFNSGRPDHTYEGIITSTGYQQLAIVPPITPQIKPVVHTCLRHSPEYLASQVPTRPLTTFWLSILLNQQPINQLSCTDSPQYLELLAYHPDKATREDLQHLTKLGFQPISTRFNPKNYYQRYPKVAGLYDGDYRDFNLWGEQGEALVRVANFLRERQIPLVYVNLPLTQIHMDGTRSAYEQEFRQFMQAAAQQGRFMLRDYNQPSWSRNEFFLDPSHVNRFGAYAITNHLAQDPLIPWPREVKAPTERELSRSLQSVLATLHRGFQAIKL